MNSFNDIIKLNTKRIKELTEYDHTKRIDLVKIALVIINTFIPRDFMDIWAEYITNPRNEQNYKYKIYVTLPEQYNNISSSDYQNINNGYQNINTGYQNINTDLPNYYTFFSYDDISDTNTDTDTYDNLILSEHLEDLLRFRLVLQYKFKIHHTILLIIQNIIKEIISSYDTQWLVVDGYEMKYKVKVKYNYQKNKMYPNFTGIIITLLLLNNNNNNTNTNDNNNNNNDNNTTNDNNNTTNNTNNTNNNTRQGWFKKLRLFIKNKINIQLR